MCIASKLRVEQPVTVYHCQQFSVVSRSPDFWVLLNLCPCLCHGTKCHTPVIWVARPLRINSSVVTSGRKGLAWCLVYILESSNVTWSLTSDCCAWASGAVSSIASAGLQMRPWKKNFETSGAGHKTQFLTPNPRMAWCRAPKHICPPWAAGVLTTRYRIACQSELATCDFLPEWSLTEWRTEPSPQGLLHSDLEYDQLGWIPQDVLMSDPFHICLMWHRGSATSLKKEQRDGWDG